MEKDSQQGNIGREGEVHSLLISDRSEENKKIPLRIKKFSYGTLITAIFISFITTVVLLAAALLIFWFNRQTIISSVIKEYNQEQSKIVPTKVSSLGQVKESSTSNQKDNKSSSPTTKSTPKKQIPTVVEAVKKAKPAVVSIVISKKTTSGTNKKVASGSGFLITSNGLIVTNSHVVSESDTVFTVILNNGKEYSATVLDRDSIMDVAFLKIQGSGFPYLKLGSSNSLQVGETVIAIGNALGEFDNTVSTGVVSGLSRNISASDLFGQTEFLSKVIQTDAAINLGNSGGPLLDIKGNVVGINVALVEGSSNIGFSLPIDSVKSSINSVEKTGRIVRPYVGIRYVVINPAIQKANNLLYDHGLWIKSTDPTNYPAILPGSPAEEAGLKSEDIILEVDDHKITGDFNFSQYVRNKKIGGFVMLKVYTGGYIKTEVVVLKQAPKDL